MATTIHTALNNKNKIVKEMSENLQNVMRYNSVEEGSDRAYEPKECLEKWKKGIDSLVELKTKIHKANAEVYGKIFKLSELKSAIKQLRNLDCNSGKMSQYGRQDAIVKTTVITVVDRDNLVKEFEAEVEKLQGELNTHNATAVV